MNKEKEEIIINDVNVAECEFLRHCVIPDNEGCKIDDSLCCDVGNCYYKQLQKLKEENQKLTETCESLLKIQYVLANSCKKYSHCLEEIKAYCKSCEYGLDAQKIINYIDEILENEVTTK